MLTSCVHAEAGLFPLSRNSLYMRVWVCACVPCSEKRLHPDTCLDCAPRSGSDLWVIIDRRTHRSADGSRRRGTGLVFVSSADLKQSWAPVRILSEAGVLFICSRSWCVCAPEGGGHDVVLAAVHWKLPRGHTETRSQLLHTVRPRVCVCHIIDHSRLCCCGCFVWLGLCVCVSVCVRHVLKCGALPCWQRVCSRVTAREGAATVGHNDGSSEPPDWLVPSHRGTGGGPLIGRSASRHPSWQSVRRGGAMLMPALVSTAAPRVWLKDSESGSLLRWFPHRDAKRTAARGPHGERPAESSASPHSWSGASGVAAR